MRKLDYEVSESREKDEGLDRIYNPAIDVSYFFREDTNNGFTYAFLLKTVNVPFVIAINDGMGFYDEFERVKLPKRIHLNEIENKDLNIFKVENKADLQLLMPYILFSVTNGCYGLVCDCRQEHLHKVISYSMEERSALQNSTDFDPKATIYVLSDVGIRIHSNKTALSDISSINRLLKEAY